jgi:hypothetical protein
MSDTIEKVGQEEYVPLGGGVVAIGAASVEQTGLTAGATYEFTATGGTALCRWDTTAAAASDGGFTFAVVPGTVVRCKNPLGNTLLNVIEAEAGSTATATLTYAQVRPF